MVKKLDENPFDNKHPYLSIMHPSHIEFLLHTPVNTLDYLLKILGSLEGENGDEILKTFIFFSQPFWEDEDNKSIKAPELNLESVKSFTARCWSATEKIAEPTVVLGLVMMILSELFRLGNILTVDETKSRLMNMAELSMNQPPTFDLPPISNEDMGWLVDHMENLPEKTQKNYETYNYFCEQVLRKLLDQPIPK